MSETATPLDQIIENRKEKLAKLTSSDINAYPATYALDGHCVFGPCTRGLDRRPLTLSANGRIVVNIADHRLVKGQPTAPGLKELHSVGHFP